MMSDVKSLDKRFPQAHSQSCYVGPMSPPGLLFPGRICGYLWSLWCCYSRVEKWRIIEILMCCNLCRWGRCRLPAGWRNRLEHMSRYIKIRMSRRVRIKSRCRVPLSAGLDLGTPILAPDLLPATWLTEQLCCSFYLSIILYHPLSF